MQVRGLPGALLDYTDRIMADKEAKRGPKPKRVKIEGDWEAAVEKALRKKRPKDGWPDADKDQPDQDPKDD